MKRESRIRQMLKRINPVLPELVLGIALYAIAVECIGIWFVEDKARFTIGLWIGAAAAIGMAIHIAIVIEDSVSMVVEKRARSWATLHALLRYAVVAVIFFLMAYFRFGNVVAAFIGIFGLKISAYLQPYLHKRLQKMTGQEETTK